MGGGEEGEKFESERERKRDRAVTPKQERKKKIRQHDGGVQTATAKASRRNLSTAGVVHYGKFGLPLCRLQKHTN